MDTFRKGRSVGPAHRRAFAFSHSHFCGVNDASASLKV